MVEVINAEAGNGHLLDELREAFPTSTSVSMHWKSYCFRITQSSYKANSHLRKIDLGISRLISYTTLSKV